MHAPSNELKDLLGCVVIIVGILVVRFFVKRNDKQRVEQVKEHLQQKEYTEGDTLISSPLQLLTSCTPLRRRALLQGKFKYKLFCVLTPYQLRYHHLYHHLDHGVHLDSIPNVRRSGIHRLDGKWIYTIY